MNKKNRLHPIRVGYIAGHGYSGSTIMDLILGAQPGVHGVGEIIHLGEYLSEDRICSCGEKVSSCSFWSEIIQKSDTCARNLYDIERPRYDFVSVLRKLRRYELRYILSGQFANILCRNDVQRYLQENYCLFKAIMENTGAHLIVDSSKNPLRMVLFHLSDKFDVNVIHMFRDHRSYLESKKRKSQDPKREQMEWSGPFGHTLKLWKGTVHQKLLLQKVPEEQKIAVPYREFATRPTHTIEAICQFLGCSYDPASLNNQSAYFFSQRLTHNIGGNRVRMQKIDRIKYLQRWPENLNKWEKIVYALLGGVILNRISALGEKRIE
jgi:hypothetical protein